jgi:GT2 family glycosyltransferase
MARLSVVVSTFQREALLRRVLDRLESQTCGPDAFTVIVAVDHAQADLAEVHRAAAGRPYVTRVVQAKERNGVSATRNAGWRVADTPVVLFVGDDMLPRAELVERHLNAHLAHPEIEAGLQGHVVWSPELKLTPFMVWLERGIQFDFGTIRGTEADWWHLYACNASLKVAALERVGGYDEAFEFGYEELDLAARLHEQGFRLIYDPDAVVEHLHPTTIEAYKKRMEVVAVAERQFVAKHPVYPAYFHNRFERAAARPPARSRGARLMKVVPRNLPVLGRRVHFAADCWFDQQLAPPFLKAWDEAERSARERV